MQNTTPPDFESFCADYNTRHREGLAKNTRYSVAKLKVCGFASQETDCFQSQQLIATTCVQPSALPKVLMPPAPAKIPASIQSVISNPYRVNGVGCRDIFAAEAQVKLQKQVKNGPAIRIEKGGVEIKMSSFQSMCSVERRRARAVNA